MSNYFNCLIILISHILQFLLIRKFYRSVQVCVLPLNMSDIIIYVARWSEKYLSKSALFSFYLRFQIRPFALLPTIYENS